MQFCLTPEQDQIGRASREFAEEEIEPLVEQIEKTGRFPRQLWEKMGDRQLLGIVYPKEYGGLGGDFMSHVVALEEICRILASVGGSCSGAHLALLSILSSGSDELKAKYLPPALKGRSVACFATTEPNASSDLMGIETKAVLEGDCWVLNGTKRYITNAPYADIAVVFAKTGERRLSAFVVDMNSAGVSVGELEETMGVKGQEICDIILDNVRVPKDNLIGERNTGFAVATQNLGGGRIVVGATGVGIAQAAFEESVKYAKQRKQFGKEIARFEVIQFYLADMAILISAARNLNYQAASLKDANLHHTRESAVAKCFGTEAAVDVTRKAVQIHGGFGYTKQAKVERLYRDAKVTEIYEGANEIQRIIIARDVLGKEWVSV